MCLYRNFREKLLYILIFLNSGEQKIVFFFYKYIYLLSILHFHGQCPHLICRRIFLNQNDAMIWKLTICQIWKNWKTFSIFGNKYFVCIFDMLIWQFWFWIVHYTPKVRIHFYIYICCSTNYLIGVVIDFERSNHSNK